MKFCPKCGLNLNDVDRFCTACGTDTTFGVAAVHPAMGTVREAAHAPTSGKAVASLILGVSSFLFSILTGIPAIVLGYKARKDIRQSGGRMQGDGIALAGLSLGYVGVAFFVLLIIPAIVIPNLLRSKMAANEASAVGSLRVIATASIAYYTTYGSTLPPSLTALGPPADGESASAEHAGLVKDDLVTGSKDGYAFSYRASSSRNDRVLDRFQANADPITEGTTGQRHFFVDQTGVIRFEMDGPANENSPPLR